MKVKTDHGVEVEALLLEGPTITDGSVWLRMKKTEVPLHEITRIFETAKRIEREATDEREGRVYTGLELVQIQREKSGTVFLQFASEG